MEGSSLVHVDRIGEHLRIRGILGDRTNDASTSSVDNLNIATTAADLDFLPWAIRRADIPSPASTSMDQEPFLAELG